MKNRLRDQKGKYVRWQHPYDVSRIQALKQLLSESEETVGRIAKTNSLQSGRILELLKVNDEQVKEIGRLELEKQLNDCSWVFLAGLVRRIPGLRFWLCLCLKEKLWFDLKTTIDRKWPVAGEPDKPNEEIPGSL
jgi:hypothetical protein